MQKIMWIAEGNCLHVEWKADPTAEGLNKVLVIQRHIIRKYGCTKVVINNNNKKSYCYCNDNNKFSPLSLTK